MVLVSDFVLRAFRDADPDYSFLAIGPKKETLILMTDQGGGSDRIHIEGLEVWARIGVPDEERAAAQRLVFNITFWPTQPKEGLHDDVARTVDYAAVCAETKRFVLARSDRLIETLADAVAMRLVEQFAIEKITIELRKFILPEVKFVSVTAVREKP